MMVDQIRNIYLTLCWFISMAVYLYPVTPLIIFVPIIIALFPFLIRNANFNDRKKDINVKCTLSMMPVFWVVIGLWGGIFRHKTNQEWPGLVQYFILFVLIFFFIFGVYSIVKNKGYRAISIFLFVVNVYFALFVSACASMSISGVWL